ncbi:MAG: signal peptidase II [Bdellovibrionales bacterium]|nr:signal peptidase II [Bdellovibrionales bacterium]
MTDEEQVDEVESEDSLKVSIKCVSTKTTAFIISLSVFLVAFLDQWTKYLIVTSLTLGEQIEIIPGFFNLTLAYNPGAAFGMMADLPDGTRQLVLAGVTLLALCVVFYFLAKDYYHDVVAQSALGLILGGALGNIIDRVRIGVVVDFLDVYLKNYHWPSFNVADSAICIGVGILVFRKPASRARHD